MGSVVLLVLSALVDGKGTQVWLAFGASAFGALAAFAVPFV
jgi:hypothetical protein